MSRLSIIVPAARADAGVVGIAAEPWQMQAVLAGYSSQQRSNAAFAVKISTSNMARILQPFDTGSTRSLRVRGPAMPRFSEKAVLWFGGSACGSGGRKLLQWRFMTFAE
jgi:hypothetical protein